MVALAKTSIFNTTLLDPVTPPVVVAVPVVAALPEVAAAVVAAAVVALAVVEAVVAAAVVGGVVGLEEVDDVVVAEAVVAAAVVGGLVGFEEVEEEAEEDEAGVMESWTKSMSQTSTLLLEVMRTWMVLDELSTRVKSTVDEDRVKLNILQSIINY